VKILARFFGMMASQPERVEYGFHQVRAACEQGAVDSLLLTDDLFRAQSVSRRGLYVGLVESVRDTNGVVHIFSSLHVSGEQLSRLGGVAAILRFPIPESDRGGKSELESDTESDDAIIAEARESHTR